MTDVAVEATVADTETDVTVEEQQTQEPETQDEAPEVESQEEGESQEVELTAEEKLEQVERERESLEKKNARQVAAYNRLQEKLEKERQEYQKATEQVATVESRQPSIDDFDTHAEYVEALSDWKAEQVVSKKEAEFKQRQEQARMQEIQEERAKIAREQESEYLSINPRYEASKGEFKAYLKTATFSPQVEDAIVSMAYKGNVPQLINYFGENNGERIEELDKISRMSPVEAAVEIYKVQQKLVTPKKEEKKPLPKPVKAAPANKSTKDLSSGSVLENLGLK